MEFLQIKLETLLRLWDGSENQNKHGSWNSPPSLSQNCVGGAYYTGDQIEDNVYRTTLCILMLEVYYHYLSTSEATGVE